MATQAATSTPAAKSPKSADGSKSVSILLEPAVHDYYERQAAADERTLNKYLARLIKQQWQAATTGSGSTAAASNGHGSSVLDES